MRTHRQFAAGMAGLCLGNGLLALSFALDQSLVGSAAMIALAGTVATTVGAAVILCVTWASPETFEFTGSPVKRHTPTVVLIGGVAAASAGALNLALAVVG